MRFLKLLGVCALAGLLLSMWLTRDAVIEAYVGDPEPIDFQLDGLNLEIEPAAIDPSPYFVGRSPDIRDAAVDVSAFPVDEGADVVLGGGSATLVGTVSGPFGPVPGAIVRVERFSTGGSATAEVLTSEAGTWRAEGLLGGRYRVRAFAPGQFASGTPSVFFLEDDPEADDPVSVSTPIVVPATTPVFSYHGTGQAYIGGRTTVAVTVAAETVDADGRLVVVPSPNVAIVGSVGGSMSLLSNAAVTADSRGAVRFLVNCDRVGSSTLSVQLDLHRASYQLPACVPLPPPPPPPVEDPPADGGTGGTSTTVTTDSGGADGTTSTTQASGANDD